MSRYVSFVEQFVTFHFCLDEADEATPEEKVDSITEVHVKAHKLLREAERNMPERITRDEEIERENFELCEVDAELVIIDGMLTHSVSFYSHAHIPNKTCKLLLEHVEKAFQAAAGDGFKFKFVEARRQTVQRVTETNAFDVNALETAQ